MLFYETAGNNMVLLTFYKVNIVAQDIDAFYVMFLFKMHNNNPVSCVIFTGLKRHMMWEFCSNVDRVTTLVFSMYQSLPDAQSAR